MTQEQKTNVTKIIANQDFAAFEDWDYVRSVAKPGQVQTIITKKGVKYKVSILFKIELGLI